MSAKLFSDELRDDCGAVFEQGEPVANPRKCTTCRKVASLAFKAVFYDCPEVQARPTAECDCEHVEEHR